MNATDTNRLETNAKVKIGDKVYIVERHFSGSRSLTDAVYETVKNEAVRLESEKKNRIEKL